MRNGTDVEQNLKELYRRVVFNIVVGNSDNHFRNHGFLLTRKGWILSPAYEINPTLAKEQSLLINRTTNVYELNILMESAGEYMLQDERAKSIINEVKTAMKQWCSVASKTGISQRHIEMFAPRIDKWLE